MLAALAELGQDVTRLRDGAEWQAWLQQCAQFHRYSFRNTMLIWFQLPTATRVAGYRAWQRMGRQVREHEHHLKILAPVTRRNADGELYVATWKMVRVFDISQTEGAELAPPPPWPEGQTCPEGLYQATVEQIAAVENIGTSHATPEQAVERSPRLEGARGWYDPATREIFVVTEGDRSEASMMGTLLHELGHHFDPGMSQDCRMASNELVAQSAAYLAGGQLGVGLKETSESYAASWCDDPADLLALADRSTHAARKILETLDTNLEVQS